MSAQVCRCCGRPAALALRLIVPTGAIDGGIPVYAPACEWVALCAEHENAAGIEKTFSDEAENYPGIPPFFQV